MMIWIALSWAAEPNWALSNSIEGAPTFGDKTRCLSWNATVEADADALYALFADIETWPSWMDEVQKVEVVEREDTRLVVDYAEGNKLYSMESRNEVTLDPEARTMVMASQPGQEPGSWMLTSVAELEGGKARLDQASCFDASWMPEWVLKSFAQSTAKEMPERIEKGLEARE